MLAAEPRRLRAQRMHSERTPSRVPLANAEGTLFFAAGRGLERPFSGKIGAPRLAVASPNDELRTLAAWEFGSRLDVPEVGEPVSGRIGVLHGGPTRAVTGPSWRGTEVDPRLAPGEYDAIHFHEDDLDDAGWSATALLNLPDGLTSGVYAVRARAGRACDRIPFFVVPAGRSGRPPIAFLAPTFTYLAYGNSMLGDHLDYIASGISGRPIEASERDRQLARHAEFAGSLYDLHADGSGRCYSSLRRPLFSFRPEWRSAVQQAPRHLSADLYLMGWLEKIGHRFDAITDGLLDLEGQAAIEPYRVIVTGSHPEYVSDAEVAALEDFVADGGRMMYLGGNGFYWITSVDRNRPYVIEVRRGNAGTRAWDSPPGETHHSTTGEPGGLWRYRGKAPNRLLGVGMASQGWDEKAPGYVRTTAGHGSDVAWIFDGIQGDRFGAEGLVMGGAAGDEIDRYDPLLGSPPNGVVVATSTGHSRFYKLVHEDQLMSMEHRNGEHDADVRSDVTLTPWPGGGGVFAVGSITWAGAMAINDFANDVARLTTNVLRRFLDPAPLDPKLEGDGESGEQTPPPGGAILTTQGGKR
jgi:N,N-dimethylformamidase